MEIFFQQTLSYSLLPSQTACVISKQPISMGTFKITIRETNLKIRQALPETTNLLTPLLVSTLDATIKSELPNNSLYTFEATLKLPGQELALSPQQLLLRGAQLKSTLFF